MDISISALFELDYSTFTPGQWIRLFVMGTQLLATITLTVQFLMNYRSLPSSVRFLKMALISLSLYAMDASSAALVAGIGWDSRLFFWMLALAFMFCYLMMPANKRHSNYGPDTPSPVEAHLPPPQP